MRLLFIIALSLTVFAQPASADALHLNPQQSADSPKMKTFGKTSIPIGYYEYCNRYSARCRQKSKPAVVNLTRARWKEIIAVNSSVNQRIRPATDQEIFGVEERWELPQNVGDCEDYVLLKRQLLAERGYPLSSLLITVARDADGGGHAVLTVVTNVGDFILDNVNSQVLEWRDAELYYLKRQSQKNPNTWVDLTRG